MNTKLKKKYKIVNKLEDKLEKLEKHNKIISKKLLKLKLFKTYLKNDKVIKELDEELHNKCIDLYEDEREEQSKNSAMQGQWVA